jgi:hypothetical protein
MIVASRRWGSDGRLCCKAFYGFRRYRSELDADRARHHRGLDCHFVVVTPLADQGNLFANCDLTRSVRLLRRNSDVPHPLPDIGNGSHRPHLVNLPSHRVLSDQAGVSEDGDGRYCTYTAGHHGTQRVCTRSRWWLR